MSPRWAARVDANHAEIVDALKEVGVSVLSLARLGQDVPDVLAFYPPRRRWALLEIKNPKRGLKKAEQHDDWPEKSGFPVHVVWSVQDALAAIGVITTGTRT